MIVEGQTDEDLFAAALRDHYEPKGIKIFQYRGDVFFKERHDKNIREKIRDFVKRELERQQISPVHVIGIVHIGDTDGTFIPDDHIIVNGEVSVTEKKRYSDTHILVVNDTQKGHMEERNRDKSENHRKMIQISKLTISNKDLPYAHFFMSSNTDHVVFNLRNLSLKEKDDLMKEYVETHNAAEIKALLEAHMDVCPAGVDPFEYTWGQIQLGINSLGRKTNTLLIYSFIDNLLGGADQVVVPNASATLVPEAAAPEVNTNYPSTLNS